jgi:hypothetical protein
MIVLTLLALGIPVAFLYVVIKLVRYFESEIKKGGEWKNEKLK